jgi:hypothetical protein
MYFGYQKDTLTSKVRAFKAPEPPLDLNGKPIPTIMLVSLTDEEKELSLDALIRMYPAP